jgi:parvulin-like peptidyl-prolyl isomerase
MKHHLICRFGLLIVVFLAFTYSVNAQKDDIVSLKELDYLTEQQQQLLNEQQLLLNKTRNVLKENLTKEQFALLSDRSISKEQRSALLKKSLSSEQRNLISTNRNLIRSKKNMFRRSLTKRQRIRLRRFIKTRPMSDRKRLVRRLRRLIQNNMD